MKLYEIVFSPTGGTKKVSNILVNALSDDITTVDLIDSHITQEKYSLTEDDLAVISVPSFGGRVPSVAIERLSMIQGNDAKTILVCVYGNRAFEDTLVELEDAVDKAGFQVVAAISAIAEHSIARQFATGRPDKDDEEELLNYVKVIKEKLQKKQYTKPEIPGNRPYKDSKGAGMIPKPTKQCVSCGVCAKECPVQAIDLNDPTKVNEKVCISCMRCVSVCPHSARKINKMMQTAAGLMLKKVCSERKENELYI